MLSSIQKQLEKTLTDGLIAAFDQLGGDPSEAERNARGWSLDDWINWQKTQVVAVGAGAALVPGAHLAAVTADLAILLHKMSYCCWGIGAIKGCRVFGKADIINILDIWTGSSIQQLHNLAITYKLYNVLHSSHTFVDVMQELNVDYLSQEDYLSICNAAAEVLMDSHNLIKELNQNEYIQLEQRVKDNLKKKLVVKKIATKVSGKLTTKLGTKMAVKLATKVSSKMAAKVLLKIGGGFFPAMGAIIGGGVNLWMIDKIASSACTYYAHPADESGINWLGSPSPQPI